jgi:hypothetical protein
MDYRGAAAPPSAHVEPGHSGIEGQIQLCGSG